MSTSTSKAVEDLNNRVSHLERVLILGDGDRLPLAEIVRSLTKTVTDYIKQKEKEEVERKKKEEEHAAEKKAEWTRWKWLILGIVVPLFFAFIGQAIYFYFRLLPIFEKAISSQ